MYNFSTLPAFLEIGQTLDYGPDEYLQIAVDIETPTTEFAFRIEHKPHVLTPKFKDYLTDLVGAEMNKVVIWHWGAPAQKMAHIDYDRTGIPHTFVINWVLNSHPSQVNFYNLPPSELKYGYGKNGPPTERFQSYVPIDVDEVEPTHIWNTGTLCMLNSGIPHMVWTEDYRIAASVHFSSSIHFDDVILRLRKKLNER
jgi:hypothetical protein